MQEQFIIVTPPRSRSAWLANFLCWGPSFCFHEALPEVERVAGLREKFVAMAFPVVGTVDNGAAHFSEALMAHFPKAKFVLIRRPLDEVKAALEDINLPVMDEYLLGIDKGMDNIKATRPALEVEYKKLGTALQTIWDYCIGPVPEASVAAWNERAMQLSRMNIELDMQKEAARLKFLSSNIESLFENDLDADPSGVECAS